ncbi:MAG: hypothetical protein QXR88_00300 [Candidatus Pacearchaeota archaeon]
MKNKKAWWRIVESIIGVLIILSALIFFVSQQMKNYGKDDKAKEILRVILDEIEKNYTIRNYIINNNNNELINSYISNKLYSISSNYNFSFCITKPYSTCRDFYQYNVAEIRKNIYSESILISYINDTNDKIETKKFILYIWEK